MPNERPVSVQDLVGIIGSQTIELVMLRTRIQELEQAVLVEKTPDAPKP